MCESKVSLTASRAGTDALGLGGCRPCTLLGPPQGYWFALFIVLLLTLFQTGCHFEFVGSVVQVKEHLAAGLLLLGENVLVSEGDLEL